MSVSIHTLLADELNIPDQKAEKLLVAMLREVRKRAQRGGVRLPDLGKFKVEDGELTFSPADSLARAVNHRFEGLESEHLRNAPEPETGKDEDSEGPSTITLGYQDSSGWTPLDADEPPAETEETEAETEADDETEADTEEFELPESDPLPSEQDRDTAPSSDAGEPSAADESATDAASPAPIDHDSAAEADDESENAEEAEAPAPASGTDEQPPESDETEEQTSDTEELYPLVDEVTGDSAPDDPSSVPDASSTADAPSPESASGTEANDEERDELSRIWASGPDKDTPDFSMDTEVDDNGDEADEDDLSLDDIPSETETDASTADPDEGTVSDEGTEKELEPSSASPPTPSKSSSEGGSPLPRVLVTLLVLVLLGGGAWYILGQRGLVPPPGQTLSELTGPSAPNQAAASAEQQAAGPSGTAAAGTSEQDAPSSSEVSEDASDSSAASPGGAAATGIEPAAGGWTIVVASRADRAAAASLVDTYQQRFQNPRQPVDVVQGTVDNTTRYRVGVGQFSSRDAADAFLNDNSDALPNGAWALALE
jgi:chemotaxis protein histidine kinase CheA